ncbi:MAG: streptomycin 3''-adenylyltransferase [Patescibacteria group bacterium]|nr:MAG: streptomycin 3''-adenylyltransferase [Patescibacteria group bacterium]
MMSSKAQSWINCDEDIKQYIQSVVRNISDLLGRSLVGIYLYGSLAMGSYYRPKSDIDLIIVIDTKLRPDLRKKIAETFVKLAENCPTVGNLEASVITSLAAKKFKHPCPFEVHYGSEWHEKIKKGEIDFSENKTDSDLASHLMYVIKRGVVLHGKEIKDTFNPIPWNYFIDSILDDFDWIVSDENIIETPFYSILNICRVIRTLSEGDQEIFSKDEGGEWGLRNLPEEFLELVQKSLSVYRSEKKITLEQRRQGGIDWNKDELLKFRDYAKGKVASLVGFKI